MDEVPSQIVLTRHKTELQIKKFSVESRPKNVRKSNFCPFSTANQNENIEKPNLKLATEFASQCTTYPSESVISHNLQMKFLKKVQTFRKNLQHTQ